MAYIHSKNLIHCDLAARNLLVDNSGTTKVADFGLASHKNDDRNSKGYNDNLPVIMTSLLFIIFSYVGARLKFCLIRNSALNQMFGVMAFVFMNYFLGKFHMKNSKLIKCMITW